MTQDNHAPFNTPDNWEEKVFKADEIWQQVKAALQATVTTLPQTPRRPDIRLIVNNSSGKAVTFMNPGDHSHSKPETVPSDGTSTAAMVMLAGETLDDQQIRAFELTKRFNLDTQGLNESFIAFLATDEAKRFVNEAYGPAPFEGQTKKLVPLSWKPYGRPEFSITPTFHTACAFGARAATNENVIQATIHVFVQGTNSTPELMENSGMVIVISEDYKAKVEKTRPIVPSVAQDFYGSHFSEIPNVVLNTEGKLQSIDLKDGTTIRLTPDGVATLHKAEVAVAGRDPEI